MKLNELFSLNEIEMGGYVDTSDFDELDKHDFSTGQLDLFKDIRGQDVNLPHDWEIVGKLGPYPIAIHKQVDRETVTYYLFDHQKPIGYVATQPPEASFGGGYHVSNPPLGGTGLRVVSVYLKPEYTGKGLSLDLYEWLLKNVCDYILPDDLQTKGGVSIWKRMLRQPNRFDVEVHDPGTYETRRRKPGNDFHQVYRSEQLRPFVTLAGKADDLLADENA